MPQEQYTISVTDPQMWRCQSVNTEVNRTVMITMEHRSSDIEGFDTLGSVMKRGQRLALFMPVQDCLTHSGEFDMLSPERTGRADSLTAQPRYANGFARTSVLTRETEVRAALPTAQRGIHPTCALIEGAVRDLSVICHCQSNQDALLQPMLLPLHRAPWLGEKRSELLRGPTLTGVNHYFGTRGPAKFRTTAKVDCARCVPVSLEILREEMRPLFSRSKLRK